MLEGGATSAVEDVIPIKGEKENKVLLISNGHGEDLLAGVLAQALHEELKCPELWAFPVVGSGLAYRRFPVKVVGVQKELPSGGWIRQDWRALASDFKAGFIGLMHRQRQALRALCPQVSHIVAVGDIYGLYLGFRFCTRPLVFVPTAKSDYIRGHLGIEKYLMKKYAGLVLPRDARTADSLGRAGVPVKYVGNLMMDAIFPSGQGFPMFAGKTIVGILPGSRSEAYLNLPLLSHTMDLIGREAADVAFVVALAGNLSLVQAVSILAGEGWQATMASPGGPPGDWQRQSATLEPGRARLLTKDGVDLLIASGRFGDVLEHSAVCIGLAGTANEQAAGLGKPVVAFPGPGVQFTAGFMAMQKRLLGAALAAVDSPVAAARAVVDILDDRKKYTAMAVCGRQRMGEPGAARRMAQTIVGLWNM